MMIKKSLYPKTKRISDGESNIIITEKLDGSNIGFFKLKDELVIATRNNIFNLEEADGLAKDFLYKGMSEWLKLNGQHLKESLNEGSGFFGEWMGMGKIKYTELDKKVYMFAKANINEKLDIYNLYYDVYLLKYPFVDAVIPEYINIVPVVENVKKYPTINQLDEIYLKYSGNKDDYVEGFVVQYKNQVSKYVRMKNGKLQKHKENS